jgi:neutral ceramidase
MIFPGRSRLAVPLWLVVLAMPAAGSAAEPPFQAGVAVVEITGPKGYRMSGYFNERFNTGTKDPLYAKALVFRQGDRRAALVICDLIGISPAAASEARKLASTKTGISVEHIAIAATHSHTGPLYFGELREYFHARAVAKHGRDPQEEVVYGDVLVGKLVEAISLAQAALAPVTIDVGTIEEKRLSFNRRFHMKDGSVRFNPGQQNADIVRVAGPIDPDVGIVRLRSVGESPKDLAALVVFALHLDTLGGTDYSADYPGVLQAELRKSLGGEFVSLFGAGTCGDINHVDVSIKGRRTTAEIGTLLAETVAGGLPKLARVTEPSLAVARAAVEVPLQRYSAEEIARAKERMDKVGTKELTFLEQVEATKIVDLQLRKGNTIALEVQAIRLSRDVAIVTLPGEVFVELGLEIKRTSPFKTTLVMELTNDTPAYIPTRRAFLEGSYEVVNSRIESGGGEAMVEAAGKLLKELAK